MSDDITDPHDPAATPDEAAAAAAPPPPPPPPPPRPRLTRSRDKVIAGVAGGLAHYLGLDPVIVRLGFVALTFFGGMGILAYILAAIVMPASDGIVSAPGQAVRRVGDAPNVVLVALMVVGGLILAASVDIEGPGVFWAMLLIALGVVLFRQDSRAAATGVNQPVVPTAGPAVSSTYDAGYDTSYADLWDIPDAPVATPRPVRQRSILGRVTIALTLLTMGLVAAIDNIGVNTMQAGQYLALAVVGIGVGLVVGAWRGRSYWLILLGAILVPPMLASTFVANVPFSGPLGESYHQPEGVENVADSYSVRVGVLTVDLTELDVTDPLEVDASVGFGQLNVVVPDDARVAVAGTIRGGETNLFGTARAYDPADAEHAFTVPATGGNEGGPTVTLDLDAGFGQINVVRESDSDVRGGRLFNDGPMFRDFRQEL